ncbi:MAG: Uma2 family endonuclease [Cyanobacteria bacterium J06638_20]
MTSSLSKPKLPYRHLQRWYPATWGDYCTLRDDLNLKHGKLSFNQGWLWVDMGGEGINHSAFCDLFTMLFGFWAVQHSDQPLNSLGRCLLEKPETQACAPDLVLYVGEDCPQWRPGDRRLIDLSTWRVPDLVGEISDTTLTSDLDEQKHLYEALGIPEYWVIDVQGERVFAFQLNKAGQYKECDRSRILQDLPISLLTETVRRLKAESNTRAAAWFAEAIAKPSTNVES